MKHSETGRETSTSRVPRRASPRSRRDLADSCILREMISPLQRPRCDTLHEIEGDSYAGDIRINIIRKKNILYEDRLVPADSVLTIEHVCLLDFIRVGVRCIQSICWVRDRYLKVQLLKDIPLKLCDVEIIRALLRMMQEQLFMRSRCPYKVVHACNSPNRIEQRPFGTKAKLGEKNILHF